VPHYLFISCFVRCIFQKKKKSNAAEIPFDEFFLGMNRQVTWIRMQFSSAVHRSRRAVLQLVDIYLIFSSYIVILALL
jgi:hypothetical protein